MAADAQEPMFNLKVVVQETGLKPDTLRAWERRYGLPQPDRTPGGHRLYSQQDINTLKWLVARQEEGLSISRAVELWRQLQAEGQAPYPALATTTSPVSPTTGNTLAELRKAWIDACLEFDEQAAEHLLTQAFALYPPEVACIELLLAALSEIGEGWYRGEYTVHQEHFASALATRRLEALVAATPAPTRAERLLIACPPEEEHTFGPLLLSLLLRRQGWDIIYVGANVPLAHLDTTITNTKPQLVVLTAQRLLTAATLQEVAFLLQQAQVPLAFGGQVFNKIPTLHQRIPGHYLGGQLEETPQKVRQLLISQPPVRQVEAISKEYQRALAHYRQHHSFIEAAVSEILYDADISDHHLNEVGYNLSRNIMAALRLGDIDFLDSESTWAANLLVNYQLPASLFCQYLEAYRDAVEVHLDERGEPIKAWLARVIADCDHL